MRFCCWCGKEEEPELCESESLERIVTQYIEYIQQEKLEA